MTSSMNVINDVIIMKKIFGIVLDDLSISEFKLKLHLIFQNFQNGRHFEIATDFLPEVIYLYLSI